MTTSPPGFPGLLLVVGAANMDISGSTPQALVAGDSAPGRISMAAGGVGRNVAENLARLGHAVRLVSIVGDDVAGHSVLAQTRAAGVDVQGCVVLAGQTTSTYLSLHGPDGEMVAAVNDMAILDALDRHALAPSLPLLHEARAVVVDANLPEATLGWLLAEAGAVPVFADPVSVAKCLRLRPWLPKLHTLKANRLEAEALWGQPVDSDAALLRAADWLHDRGVRQVVLSLGPRGAFASAAGGERIWAPAVPAPIHNATGAGDALLAGLVHSHRQGLGLAQAMAFALGCAAMTMDAPQANHPGLSVAAVEELLRTAPLRQ